MKRIIAGLLIATMLAGCGEPLTVKESTGKAKTYPTYGFLNKDTNHSNEMCYEVSVGNIVWSILLAETIIAPVYFLGFDLFNPIGHADSNGKCGIDAQH